jgi:hypothetical protein
MFQPTGIPARQFKVDHPDVPVSKLLKKTWWRIVVSATAGVLRPGVYVSGVLTKKSSHWSFLTVYPNADEVRQRRPSASVRTAGKESRIRDQRRRIT